MDWTAGEKQLEKAAVQGQRRPTMMLSPQTIENEDKICYFRQLKDYKVDEFPHISLQCIVA